MQQMQVPTIERSSGGKFFDGSIPDYTQIMLEAGKAKASTEIANNEVLLRAQALELDAHNKAIDQMLGMAELAAQIEDSRAKNALAGNRNTLDWFRTGLEAQQNRATLGLKMQELEQVRQYRNAEIGARYAEIFNRQGRGGGVAGTVAPANSGGASFQTGSGFRQGVPASFFSGSAPGSGMTLGGNSSFLGGNSAPPSDFSTPIKLY